MNSGVQTTSCHGPAQPLRDFLQHWHNKLGDLDTHRNLANTGLLSWPSGCEHTADWKSLLTLTVIKAIHVNAHIEAICFPPVKVLD